ncbi:hypothetical protein [Caulobacter sp. DWR1-3-2b1]|uniref:hypothetical protein n=1 Tax=Caulobacter sp. DWR1-3-2b1 TaxID=2804670 RepID=UPI003CF862CA
MRGGLIRSAAAGQARVRGLPTATPAPAAPPPPSALELENAALQGRIEDLQEALEAARDEATAHELALAKAVAEARDEGIVAGRGQADEGREAALDLLAEGLERAIAAQSARVDTLEVLATQVARSGLEQVLGPGAPQAQLVSAIIAEQIRRLAGETVVRIEVSAQDFPDAQALAELAEGRGGIDIVALERLSAGGCHLGLRLGALEVGAADQWSHVRRVLDDWLAEAQTR